MPWEMFSRGIFYGQYKFNPQISQITRIPSRSHAPAWERGLSRFTRNDKLLGLFTNASHLLVSFMVAAS